MGVSTDNVVAWTVREGPGAPPNGPDRRLSVGLAGTLAVIFSAMLFTDTLCPEHRAWVQGFALAALVGVVASIVGLVRSRAYAPVWALASALCGVAIGVLDAAHAPGRGRAVAAGFALVAAGAALLVSRQIVLARWQRRMALDLVSGVEETALAANDRRPTAAEPAPAPPSRAR